MAKRLTKRETLKPAMCGVYDITEMEKKSASTKEKDKRKKLPSAATKPDENDKRVNLPSADTKLEEKEGKKVKLPDIKKKPVAPRAPQMTRGLKPLTKPELIGPYAPHPPTRPKPHFHHSRPLNFELIAAPPVYRYTGNTLGLTSKRTPYTVPLPDNTKKFRIT